MSPYRTVNYLGYRVSVSTSAARVYARKAESLAREASRVQIRSGPDHCQILIPEIQAQTVRAEAAAARAQAALDRCWAIASNDPRGPVIRVSDRSRLLFPEDDSARATIAECYEQAQSARAEAHVALDIVEALCARVGDFGHEPDDSYA